MTVGNEWAEPGRRKLVAVAILSCALLVASCSSTTDSAAGGDSVAGSTGSSVTKRPSASGSLVAGSASTVPVTSGSASGSSPSNQPIPDDVSPSAPTLSTTAAVQPPPTTADQPNAAAPPPPPANAAPTTVPGEGNVAIEIPDIAVSTQAAVPLTSSASFSGAVTATVASVRSTTAEAIGPGEIGGPAIAVTVEIVNGSADPVDLDSVYVTLNDSTDSPAISTSGDPASPLSGALPAGARAQGVYVFTVAESLRDPVTVLVGYSTAAEVVSFVGNVT